MKSESYQLQLNKIKNLPPLPEVSIRIINTVNDPEVTVNELVDVLSLSPSLAARLLGLANSAYFGCSRPVNELRLAIIQVLGLNLVKSLSLSIALNVQLDTLECRAFKADFHWSNALTTAVLAQKLSESVKDQLMSPITVYTAGLLLNIGILVAVFLFPKEMNEVFLDCEESQESVVSGIQRKFGENPYKLGFQLLNNWGLPDVYQIVLREYDSPDYFGEERKLIMLLQLSQSLSKMIHKDTIVVVSEFDSMLGELSLSADRLSTVVNEIIESRQEIQELATIITG